jgi:hypothetical protein
MIRDREPVTSTTMFASWRIENSLGLQMLIGPAILASFCQNFLIQDYVPITKLRRKSGAFRRLLLLAARGVELSNGEFAP